MMLTHASYDPMCSSILGCVCEKNEKWGYLQPG
jgi:hypothetical protein